MPNCRRRRVDCSWDCVACQAERRDSRGWVLLLEEAVEEDGGCREARRVSCRPGAEGALREVLVDEAAVLVVAVVLDVDLGWEARGAMRRDMIAGVVGAVEMED